MERHLDLGMSVKVRLPVLKCIGSKVLSSRKPRFLVHSLSERESLTEVEPSRERDAVLRSQLGKVDKRSIPIERGSMMATRTKNLASLHQIFFCQSLELLEPFV